MRDAAKLALEFARKGWMDELVSLLTEDLNLFSELCATKHSIFEQDAYLTIVLSNEIFRNKLKNNPDDYARIVCDILQKRQFPKGPIDKSNITVWAAIIFEDLPYFIHTLKKRFVEELFQACHRASKSQGFSIFIGAQEGAQTDGNIVPAVIAILSERRDHLYETFCHENYRGTALYHLLTEIHQSNILHFCFDLSDYSNSAYRYALNTMRVLLTLENFEINFISSPVELPDAVIQTLEKLKDLTLNANKGKEIVPSTNMNAQDLLKYYLPLIESVENQYVGIPQALNQLRDIQRELNRSTINNLNAMAPAIIAVIDKLHHILAQESLYEIRLKAKDSTLIFGIEVTFSGVVIAVKNKLQELLNGLEVGQQLKWAQEGGQGQFYKLEKPVELEDALREGMILHPRQYYQLCVQLEIDPCASWSEMSKGFRKWHLRYHPDKLAQEENNDEAGALYEVIRGYFDRLNKHREAIARLSSPAVEYLLYEWTDETKKANNNREYNRFLLGHILHHTTEEHQRYLFLGPIANRKNLNLTKEEKFNLICRQLRLCLWEHSELLLPIAKNILQLSLRVINQFFQFEHIVFNLALMKKILSGHELSIVKNDPQLLGSKHNGVVSKEWVALANLYDGIEEDGKIRESSIKKFINFFVPVGAWLKFIPVGTWLKTVWLTNSMQESDLIKIPYYRFFMQVFLDEFGEASEKSDKEDLLLDAFAYCYFFHPDMVTQKMIVWLSRRYEENAHKNGKSAYITWLIFDARALAKMPLFDDNSQVQIAEILIKYHGDVENARKILLPLYEKLKARKLDLSVTDMDPASDVNRYFRVMAALKKINYNELSPEENVMALIPTWSYVRGHMLQIINEFMVINEECHTLLTKSRRELICIDRQQDLSDKAKFTLTLQVFVALIDEIETKSRGGVVTKITLVLKLKPLARRFFEFIEDNFFLISQDNALYKKVTYVEKAPEAMLKDIRKLPRGAFRALARLRLVEAECRHEKAFFNPGWDMAVYEALDRLRQLAYNKQNSVLSSFIDFFGKSVDKQHAVIIFQFVETIQFLSPEKIMEELQKAKETYAHIPGFIFAINDTRREISRIAGLIANHDDSVLLIESDKTAGQHI